MLLRDYILENTTSPKAGLALADYSEGKISARDAMPILGTSHQTVHNKLAAVIRYAYKQGYQLEINRATPEFLKEEQE